MSGRRRGILVAVLVIGGTFGLWLGVLAMFGPSTGQGDCPVNPPAAVPGPPVVVGQ